MTTRGARISVCIPTRNRAATLREALRSALSQDVDGLEVVVCDDGSTDDTRHVVRATGDRRVRYVRRLPPAGVARARNACLVAARGEFVAWLDSDDVYEPGALRRLAETLERDPAISMVHAAHSVIDADGARLPDWPRAFDADRVEEGREAFAELVLENYVAAPTVVARRDAHARAGPYAEGLERGEDWEMWLRLALEGRIAYRREPLARYRYHADSLSGPRRGSLARVRDDARVVEGLFERHGDRIPGRVRHRRRAELALAARALDAVGEAYTRDEPREARAAARFAAERAPGLGRSALEALDAALEARDDYAVHRAARVLLRRAGRELAGSRFGDRLLARVEPDPVWERTLEEMAAVVRRVVPADARIAVADKWDPTLRHLSGRPGRTFPDRRLLPDGYPPDSALATRHLEQVRREGVRYLVFTEATRWWLEHYEGFAAHLARRYRVAWEDHRCVIYDVG